MVQKSLSPLKIKLIYPIKALYSASSSRSSYSSGLSSFILKNHASPVGSSFTSVGLSTMAELREEKLSEIPVTLWGKIVDRYLDKYVGGSCWDFLNAGTDVIWHEKKPTMATFNHNTYFVDGMMSYVG